MTVTSWNSTCLSSEYKLSFYFILKFPNAGTRLCNPVKRKVSFFVPFDNVALYPVICDKGQPSPLTTTTTNTKLPGLCPSVHFCREYARSIDYSLNSIICIWQMHRASLESFRKLWIHPEKASTRQQKGLGNEHFSSMRPVFARCEHIQSSLLPVPELLGRQLLRTGTRGAAVIIKQFFLLSSCKLFQLRNPLSPALSKEWLSREPCNINTS